MKALLVSLAGGELTAIAFISALDPEVGVRAIFLPAVFTIGGVTGLVAGFLFWPVVWLTFSDDRPFAYVAILYTVTVLGTYGLMRFAHLLLAPLLSVCVGFIIGTFVTRCFREVGLSSDVGA